MKKQSDQEHRTDSGIVLENCYYGKGGTDERPGQFPFTRGIHEGMYRSRLWTMRQYAGFSTAEESNKRYRYLLEQGTTGLSVAFDLPTQIGYDSDHALSEGEVGKVGVAIDSLEDMEVLFDQIRLDQVSTSMTINATGFILLALYIALAKKQRIPLNKISGTIQNDILKEYAARGTYIYPPKPSIKIITDIFEFCSAEVPRWNTISVSGYHIREAGSTAVQELAFTLANGREYIRSAQSRGLDINKFARRISFFFNAHNNFFEEIAKFRAARRLWAQITKQLGATDPKAQMLRFHTQTAGSSLTAQQPMNNISRVTLQALSAVLGGTQSLHTNGFDEALSLPTEQAAKTALRTQQIIAFESGVTEVVDPLGGSHFVEHLTDQMTEKACEYLDRIDEMGGAVAAVESEYIQTEIASSSYTYQQQIESRDKKIIGLNHFREETAEKPPLFKVDESIRKIQSEKLAKLRVKRNQSQCSQALNEISSCAKGAQNLMPAVIKAVESYCTLGEIADELRKVYGEYSG